MNVSPALGESPAPVEARPAASVEARPAALAEAPASVPDEPVCVRVKGAAACVGPDGSDRPGVTVEDTAPDKLHAVVEYYLDGYLGTKYVIHNLGREGDVRGSRGIGSVVTFRASVYQGGHRVRTSRWKTVRDATKYPVRRETRVTPASARARSQVCTSTRNAATLCFSGKEGRNTVVFACDTRADEYQARAEYYLGGDPTARFEIHQLAGENTCGKAEHDGVAMSMYRASLFDQGHRVATRLYKYH
ncbi:hypothetical protein [Nonomuraea rhodomycinica]|uniref:Uncharacterized protein n=1 Tax=Nonomuraea rhodomycinica TaxID=1712872 RepID=A0A7Y6IVN4_9ACTN|nr:hypothetical protein [Nonomuraea rhodomycinica]NUW43929.1 hypothetical protein [Nonomuraea rhodomycinica]